MGFNSGFTAIRTIEGDKYIKDIVVGMSVMSYKESYHIAKKLVQELATKYDVSYNIRCYCRLSFSRSAACYVGRWMEICQGFEKGR